MEVRVQAASGHFTALCPLYPRKRTFARQSNKVPKMLQAIVSRSALLSAPQWTKHAPPTNAAQYKMGLVASNRNSHVRIAPIKAIVMEDITIAFILETPL